MEWPEVSESIAAGKSRMVEFKRELGNLEQVGRAICALANSDGGVVIIGVDDDGEIVGVPGDPLAAQERLATLLRTGCSAPVIARQGMHRASGRTVHWVEVLRQTPNEPFRHGGRFWVRRDRSTVTPSALELQELFNRFGYVLNEEQVITAARLADIDVGAFRTHQRRQGIDTEDEPPIEIEDDLLGAGVLSKADGELKPTLYGLMVFGRGPQNYPQCGSFYVQCARYLGKDRAADIASAGDSSGRLEDQINRSMGWFRSLGRAERYRGWHREDLRLVPEKALREAIVNAVVHRDYAITGSRVMLEVFDDRIDVTSPGTLPNRMTVRNVLTGGRPRSRNEGMAHAILVARLMEQRGRGWPVMRRAMREFNGTEPELIHDRVNRFVRVRFELRPGR